MDEHHVIIRIPHSRRSKNHLNSLYFGALCVGADLAAGAIAHFLIQETGNRCQFLFKDFQANFLKRAESDTYFYCHDGHEIQAAVTRALETKERQNLPVKVIAKTPKTLGDETVADFTLTLSIKAK